MPRTFALLLALATLSATAATAQSTQAPSTYAPEAYGAGPATPSNFTQAQAAPIERAPAQPGPQTAPRPHAGSTATQPIPGVWLRVAPNGSVQTVSSGTDSVELRVERGRANISVDHPAENTQILVDLPGGQTALLKDGLYTFNAETNTLRVLKGEADAFPGNADRAVHVREDQEMAFGAQARARDVGPAQLRADLLPGGIGEGRGDGRGYARGPYGDGFYGRPYYAYPYYGWPYYAYGPWGYGYPFGFGIGFGYYARPYWGIRGGYYGYRGFRR